MSQNGHLLFIIAMLPFLGALLPGLMIRAGRTVCATFTAVPTALALIMLLILAPAVLRGEVIQAELEWLPSLGLSASFFLAPYPAFGFLAAVTSSNRLRLQILGAS